MIRKILTVVLLLIFAREASALDFKGDKYAHDLVARISHETLNSEYEKAITHSYELINLQPREPMPRFLLATIYMYVLRSYWDFPVDGNYEIYKRKFEAAALEAKKACDNYPSQEAMIYFVRGMVLGTEALVHLQNKEWLESYSKGKSGIDALEKSLEMDPENYDAYLGLGMFEYYCSKLTGGVRILAWIVGFRGNSEKGIEYVSKALKFGKYAQGAAKVFLAYAFIEFENKLEQGVELTRSLRSEYPRNFLYVEYVLRAAKKLPPERAEEGVEWIKSVIKTPKWRDDVIMFLPYNLDMVEYVQACLYLSTENYASARDLLEPIAMRTSEVTQFSTNVNLLLLMIYRRTENHERAQEVFSLIMGNKSIDNSHTKAKEILSS